MPGIVELTPLQLDAASMIASGMTQKETAVRCGASRSSIGRWLRLPEFKEEIQRRRSLLSGLRSTNSRTLEELAEKARVCEIAQQLEDVRVFRAQARKTANALSQLLMSKAVRRLQDLPDEAITPSLIPTYIQVAIALKRESLEDWAQEIGLDAIAEAVGLGEE